MDHGRWPVPLLHIRCDSTRGSHSFFRFLVDDGIWLVTFMDYDLGYTDLEEKTLQPLNNPFGPKV